MSSAMRGWLQRLLAGCVAPVLLWLAAAAPAAAHDVPGQTRIHVLMRAQGDRLHVLVRVPLDLTLNLDLPKHGSGYLDLANLEQRMPAAAESVARDLVFYEDGDALVLGDHAARIALPSDKSFQDTAGAFAAFERKLPAGTDVFWNQGYLDARLEYPLRTDRSTLAVDFAIAPGLSDRVRFDVRYESRDGRVRAYDFATASGRIPLDPRWHQAAWTFVQSGIAHILGGVDHLLFLLCLVLPYRRLSWSLVGVVTAFTVAHATTIVAASLGWIPKGDWFPPFVETTIALSILYMAIENVLKPNLQRRWIVTALFGLVHGFGFSFALANEMQFAGDHLLLSLLAFNVGIELGQLAALVLAWPVLVFIFTRPQVPAAVVVAIVSALAGHTAWHWAAERYDALVKAGLPDLAASDLARGAAALLIVIAVWLSWRAWLGRRTRLPADGAPQ